MKQRKWTKQEIIFLKEYYPIRGSEWCAEKLNRSISSVKNATFTHKIKNIYIQKIDLNKLKTPSGAYILGLLWADGHVTPKRNIVTMSIAKEDAQLIERHMFFMGDWGKYDYQPQGGRKIMTCFYLSDKGFRDFLANMDYVNKSCVDFRKIYNFLGEELQQYFVRGFFDGDGSISFRDKAKKSASISFAGPHDYPWTTLSELFSQLNIRYKIHKSSTERGGVSHIVFCKTESVLKFFRYLYKGELLGFPRKFQKFQELVKRVQKFQKENGHNFTIKSGRYLPVIKCRGKIYPCKTSKILEEAIQTYEDKHKELKSDRWLKSEEIRKIQEMGLMDATM